MDVYLQYGSLCRDVGFFSYFFTDDGSFVLEDHFVSANVCLVIVSVRGILSNGSEAGIYLLRYFR